MKSYRTSQLLQPLAVLTGVVLLQFAPITAIRAQSEASIGVSVQVVRAADLRNHAVTLSGLDAAVDAGRSMFDGEGLALIRFGSPENQTERGKPLDSQTKKSGDPGRIVRISMSFPGN